MGNYSTSILFKSFLRKLSTSGGIAMAILSLIGVGFTMGIYYSDYIKNKEMTLLYKELIEKDIRYNSDIDDLKYEIQLLKIENEKIKSK